LVQIPRTDTATKHLPPFPVTYNCVFGFSNLV
jgi:hypothetical protein